MASGIICQSCGVEAPTRFVNFHQNIGMLVMRTRRNIKGMLCKKCVHKNFWQMTMTTLFLGPWGTISLIIAPCFVVNNVVRYLAVLGMPAVPKDAKWPQLDATAIAQLAPHRQKLVERLNSGEQLPVVATDIAQAAKVTPGQVALYVAALAKQNRDPNVQAPKRGFPVLPPKPVEASPPQAIPVDEIPTPVTEMPPLPPEEPRIGA